MTETNAQYRATVADARAMAALRNHTTAWCLLRNAEGLEPHATMDDVDPSTLSADGLELFELLLGVGEGEALNHEVPDSLEDALFQYNRGNEEAAYEALDGCPPALAMVQRWDMTYSEYMEWLDSVCQG